MWLAWSRVQPLSSSAGQDANSEVTLPDYVEKQGETVEVLRARLQYQSRKRGTLENGLLLRYWESVLPPVVNVISRFVNFEVCIFCLAKPIIWNSVRIISCITVIRYQFIDIFNKNLSCCRDTVWCWILSRTALRLPKVGQLLLYEYILCVYTLTVT